MYYSDRNYSHSFESYKVIRTNNWKTLDSESYYGIEKNKEEGKAVLIRCQYAQSSTANFHFYSDINAEVKQ